MPTPPSLARWLLLTVLHPVDRAHVLGDLEETFRYQFRRVGVRRAQRWYWHQVLLSFFPLLMRALYWSMAMWKNHLKMALRALGKHKGYALVNGLGLTVGLAGFILIALFVRFELSYDRFHEKADRIFRIAKEDPDSNYLGTNQFTVTSAPLAPALMDEFPEVEYATQLVPVDALLRIADARFSEKGLYATAHFFDVFSFELVAGDTRTALAEPGSIVLTTSLARAYFGATDPIGQTVTRLESGRSHSLTVTGIVSDPPPNSHISFDFLLSMRSWDRYVEHLARGDWDSNNYRTYVSLQPGSDVSAFATNLVALAQDRLGEIAYYKEQPGRIPIYFPQPLKDIHLRSHLNFELGANGDIRYVYLFSWIGFLILLIACINYMNLATARSVMRAREVGVRKVMGARRAQLVGQFLTETMLIAVVAVGLALLLVALCLPAFNALTAREMSFASGDLDKLVLTGVGLALLVGLIAGSYPALLMSGHAPLGVMKGIVAGRMSGASFRNALVVAQFAATTVLLVATMAMSRQMRYIQTAQTGVDREHVLSIPIEDPAARERYPAMKSALESQPNVLAVTGAWYNPTQISSQSGTRTWEGSQEGDHISVYHMPVQPEFFDLFRMELVEGRFFGADSAAGAANAMVINETMRRQLGWETAAGKWFTFRNQQFQIVGVMKDFNFLSLHQAIEPLAFYPGIPRDVERVLVKVRPDGLPQTLSALEKAFATFSPEYPFAYEFLDDAYNKMYETDVRLSRLIGYFTALALFIACLGLLGLTTFVASRRTKEIGVRKVLGASLADILVLLSMHFLKLVAFGFLVAIPLAYIGVRRWLEDFAFQIDVGPGLFALAGACVAFVALATISIQSVRAAQADPVESLRYE
ncbi:MAG: ABC transporter permease [Rhodothermales bacterium]